VQSTWYIILIIYMPFTRRYQYAYIYIVNAVTSICIFETLVRSSGRLFWSLKNSRNIPIHCFIRARNQYRILSVTNICNYKKYACDRNIYLSTIFDNSFLGLHSDNKKWWNSESAILFLRVSIIFNNLSIL